MALVDQYRRLKSPVRPFVRRHWRNPVLAGAAHAAQRYLAIYENNDHDLAVNGEAEIVRRLDRFRPRVVLDVGAYEGAWTQLVRDALPSAKVHCFEPSPDVAPLISERFRNDSAVVVNQRALGPDAGRSMLYVHRGHASLTSLVPSDPCLTEAVQVEVERGDRYVERAGIDQVDLLKIDAEGYDLQVLRGFGESLEAGRVDVVQFEYNTWNIRSRFLLADFFDLLTPLGYRVGKLHPDGVDFRDYSFDQENWIGPACIAVRADRADLLEALAAGSSTGRR